MSERTDLWNVKIIKLKMKKNKRRKEILCAYLYVS